VNFRKYFHAESKVQLNHSSNHNVGSFPAALPARSPWTHDLAAQRTALSPERPEETSWRKLYEEHHLVARRFLMSMGVQRDTIEDACQDVFLQAFRYLPKFRGECSFKTWLYRICASEARRYRQRAKLRKGLLHLLSTEPPPPYASEGEWGQHRAEQLVNRALGKLPETERLVFVLYELEGLPGKEIAEIAGCPEATVWRRLHYARKTFRKAFGAGGVQP
jgi:RNA polymerase sigma factor (sigma-70 family)